MATTQTMAPLIPPRTRRSKLPNILVALSAAMALFGVAGIYFFQLYPLAVVFLPLIVCAFVRYEIFMIIAMILVPFTISLTGEGSGSGLAAFGISDLCLALALPGLIGRIIANPGNVRLSKMTLPVLAFLSAGLLSFVWNIPLMKNSVGSYFIGYIRTTQVVLILPVLFSVVDWTDRELRNIFRGYVFGSTVLGVFSILGIAAGGAVSVIGNQKNGTGLALALANLIIIAALTQPENKSSAGMVASETLRLSKRILYGILIICIFGQLASLSRGSILCLLTGLLYISIVRKRGRIFGVVLVVATLLMALLLVLLPDKQVDYVKDISSKRYSNHTRLDQAEFALKRFNESPLLGDGFRVRRDYLPHNLEITLLAECGILGSILFVWMIAAQFRTLAMTRRMIQGNPLYDWIIVSVTATIVALLTHSQTDPYWRRGPIWLPWAGTGLVLSILRYETERRRKTQQNEQILLTRKVQEERQARRELKESSLSLPDGVQ